MKANLSHKEEITQDKTVDEVINDIDAITEPVVGCPTIHYPNQRVRRDYEDQFESCDSRVENQPRVIGNFHIQRLISNEEAASLIREVRQVRERRVYLISDLTSFFSEDESCDIITQYE